ncbi:MAG: DUF2721 domain-containing protein [Euryarchaeota archaeon]|nr:DUF2721 domain-containing protein [Euryarchaeota archaeon]
MAADPLAVIQATLAPAFLISGTSIFLNFSQTRLFRVVDRLREVGEHPPDHVTRPILERRAVLLRNAIAVGVFTVALTVVTAILLMGGTMLARPALSSLAPYVFALAMASLLLALFLVLYDTVLSVRSVTHR